MFVRNHKGEIIEFKVKQILNEYMFYTELWKIKYNIDLTQKEEQKEVMRSVLNYINGIKDFV